MRTANNRPETKLKDKLRIAPAKRQRWKRHLKRQQQLKKQYQTKESEYLKQRHGLDTQYRVYLRRQQFDLAETWEAKINELQQEWDSWLQEFTRNPVAEKVIVKMALKREEQNHD